MTHRVPPRARPARTRLAVTAIATVAIALTASPALADTTTGGATASSGTTTGTSSSSSTGLSKSTIKAAQRELGLRADGVLGARTRTAIRRFQRREDLDVTGRLDGDTLDALHVDTDAPAATATAGTTGTAASTGTPTPAGPAPTGAVAAQLETIARCESGGDPTAVSPSGEYHGKYQFSQATWESVGGTGDPAAAPEAEQDARAAQLLSTQGPDAWPVCSQPTS